LKFALFEAADDPIAGPRGIVEESLSSPHMVAKDSQGRVTVDRRWSQGTAFSTLLDEVIAWAEKQYGTALGAVGHRIVHGGPKYAEPQIVTEALLKQLDALVALAPLHEPHNIAPIRVLMRRDPGLPQIACFDTGFHRTMPAVATRFAIPRNFEGEGVRRYGFHGLSYEYIAGRLREVAPKLARGRVIVAHLGNGASLCALKDSARWTVL
jgi:acetate kinase